MPDDPDVTAPPEKSAISRIFINVAWLMGGKGFAAICSVIYLALMARGLGVKGFGHFSLIAGTGQALSAIAGFQTWRVVVRYGVEYVHHAQWDKFGRLVAICAIMDVVGAIGTCALAAILIYGFADALDLNPAYIDLAFYYCVASAWTLNSAMTGVLRTLDRFEAIAILEAIPLFGRLVAALIVWWIGPTVAGFLIGWALASLIGAALFWVEAWRRAPQALTLANLVGWRCGLQENPGIWRFLWVTYSGSTIDAATKQGPLLAVGALAGTRSAGLFRMASQLAQSLSKLSTTITRAVYPELARARVTADFVDFRRLAIRLSLMAGGAGLVVVLVALLFGRQILGLIGGDGFGNGAAVLVPLTIAASFDLASLAFEPVLHSTGHARLSLAARIAAVVVLGIGLFALAGHGATGAAWAVMISGLVCYVMMGAMALWALRHKVPVAPDDILEQGLSTGE
ncbi:lipopolysaccharide biosynthesis protein [Novosphingobium colocasiae]|uniref:Teichoic acid transporter n=1 Tax=Novosphingobium colocasiae TaxID=1256513 RepID=A0A918PDM3_9SPHN|nr:oligosaccharide flippase family protein [Novosphingobium colocasiae]GGY99234.1 teichoic acid transporter [Novosphingobium colocasiae]